MSQLPPAGWHPDPLGRQAQRYWDGQQWTEHVADQSGNMSTDPLDGQGQQTQQAQADQGSAAAWSGSQDTPSQDTGQAGSPAGGSQQPATDWGQQDAGGWGALPAEPDQATAGGFDSTWGDDGASGDADPATGVASTSDATSGGVSDAAAAGGAVAAAGAAAATGTDAGDTDDAVATGDATAATTAAMDSAETADDFRDEEDANDWSGGVVAMEVTDDDPIVAAVGAVVARTSDVTMSERDDGDALAGSGTVWLGAGGNEVTVITLHDPGLTVNRAALVAHSGGLDRQDTHPGIVGFAGVRLSGAGWVALSAHGGLAEVPTSGGIEVASTALVAFTNDLDVSHADTVNLSGLGVALVSGG